MRKLLKSLGAAAVLAAPLGAYAVDPDATAIITTATTAFASVGALVISMVGFYIIVRIVKKVRG